MAPVAQEEEMLPSEFDAVVIGTGLVESMLAAALARAGERVLHVDAFDHYGGDSAGFGLDGLQTYAEAPHRPAALAECGSNELPLAADSDAIRFHPPKEEQQREQQQQPRDDKSSDAAAADRDEEEELSSRSVAEEVVEALVRLTRVRVARRQAEARCKRFNLDLCPRLNYARGDGTDAMIALGVAPYLEFAGVKATYYVDDDAVTKVPCSKRDVFTARDLRPADKRKLMRFLHDAFDASSLDAAHVVNERDLTASRGLRRPQNKTAASFSASTTPTSPEEEEALGEEEESFESRLREGYGLDDRMAHVVSAAVALLPEEGGSWPEGLKAVGRHLRALGAHVGCDSPLMAPLYGSAELPQAFCRACAVQGGVYALRTKAQAIQLDDDLKNEITGVRFLNQVVRCSKVVVSADYVPLLAASEERRTYRRIVLMLPTSRFGNLPVALAFRSNVRAALFDASTYAVPEGLDDVHILHLETEGPSALAGGGENPSASPLAALDEALAAVVRSDEILWSWTYSWPQHAEDVKERPKTLAVVKRLRPHFDVFQEVKYADGLAKSLGLRHGLALPSSSAEEEEENPTVTPPQEHHHRRQDDEDDLILQDLVDAIEQSNNKEKKEADAISMEKDPPEQSNKGEKKEEDTLPDPPAEEEEDDDDDDDDDDATPRAPSPPPP